MVHANKKDHRFILSCLIIVSITAMAFSPSLKNGFTNWDDDRYITADPTIKALTAGNIATIFSTVYLNHYLPVTMLSFMGEYSLFKLNAAAYHGTSLLLHIVNALLLFGIIFALSRNYFVGLLTALMFAVHPLNVETVAWIAERKGVLSTSFYFISLFSYIQYRKSSKRLVYLLCICAFVLSLLSKSMGISLPIVLVLLDFVINRKIDKKAIVEKIPFAVLSLVFVCITYFSAHESMAHGPNYSTAQHILAPAYSIVFYLAKALVPVHLSALYILGDDPGLTLKMAFAAAGVFAAAFAVYCSRHYFKIGVFSALFFLVTVLPVLQIVPSGGWTILADRYTYLPMIAVYLLFALGCWYLAGTTFKKNAAARTAIVLGCCVIVVVLATLTFNRCGVWKNSLSLWDNVIATSPSAVAYTNRGFAYATESNYTRAIEDYDQAIALNPLYAVVYNNRGNAYYATGEHDRALNDYNQAIALEPTYPQAFNNRGIVYKGLGEFDRAIGDFSKALALDPTYAQAYGNLGSAYCFKGDLEQSLLAFSAAIRLDPQFAAALYGRGLALCFKGDFEGAVDDFSKAISINPTYGEAYNSRGVAYRNLGELTKAIESFDRAIALNSQYAQAYFGRGRAYKDAGDYARGLDDMKQACALGISAACSLSQEH